MAGELILIVEDNEKNLKLVRDVLQFKGYQTLEANNAADGIALAQAHRPHLILMDIQLPGADDGIAALRHIRALPATASIPVIALTAFAMSEDRERFLGAGFDGYVLKPIDIKAFPDQIRQFCEQTHKDEQHGTAPEDLGSG
jgi:two-component system, cell cycle response regulator DivK